jgi:2'-5' RNA ligase
VAGDERLRLFCALELPRETVQGLVAWQERLLCPAGGRLVPGANLHITLAFLGSTQRGRLDDVAGALREAAGGVAPAVLTAVRYRETRSVGMVVLDDEDGRAARLAGDLGARLERLGLYRREKRPWLPHVTVVRFRERPRLDPPVPELGSFVSSESTVRMSVLRPTGAEYSTVESVALGG